jgi:hypothetical protein
MKILLASIAFMLGLVFCGIVMGWALNEIYELWHYEKELNGLYLGYSKNWSTAINHAQDLDKGGDWVCVNVRDMDYETALKTCSHEVGHEIFAEFCDEGDNIDKCIQLVNETNETE